MHAVAAKGAEWCANARDCARLIVRLGRSDLQESCYPETKYCFATASEEARCTVLLSIDVRIPPAPSRTERTGHAVCSVPISLVRLNDRSQITDGCCGCCGVRLGRVEGMCIFTRAPQERMRLQ